MKKIIVVALAVLFLFSAVAVAEELSIGDSLKKIPNLKQGVAYSLIDNDVSYLSTVEVAKWKGIAIEAGYSSKDKVVAVISYELLKLKDLGVTMPILDLIEARIGIYAGYGRLNLGIGDRDNMEGNNEFDAGLSLTLIQIKF